MASRENYNIRKRLKRSKGFKNKIYTILFLIKSFYKRKYIRKLIIKDSIYTPFHKLITCKIKPHDFYNVKDEGYYFCLRCSHVITTKDHEQYIRSEKIKRINKKTKKRKWN